VFLHRALVISGIGMAQIQAHAGGGFVFVLLAE
jgi:hypothetical protein